MADQAPPLTPPASLIVITGAQIRHARELLGWSRFQLAHRAKLHPAVVERAERSTGAFPITAYQAIICQTLEAASVEFTDGDQPGVKLRAKGKRAK